MYVWILNKLLLNFAVNFNNENKKYFVLINSHFRKQILSLSINCTTKGKEQVKNKEKGNAICMYYYTSLQCGRFDF